MAKGVKTGGRKPGTPNKLTSELRVKLKTIVEAELEALPEQIAALEGKERIELLIKLIPYVLPKVQPTNYKDGEPINFDDAWSY